MTAPLNSATIGIQNATGTDGLTVVFNAAYVHNNMAVRFAAIPPWLSTSPNSGSLAAGASVDVTVGYDASGLCGSHFDANLHVLSNDPVTPDKVVPVGLDLIGQPDIQALPGQPRLRAGLHDREPHDGCDDHERRLRGPERHGPHDRPMPTSPLRRRRPSRFSRGRRSRVRGLRARRLPARSRGRCGSRATTPTRRSSTSHSRAWAWSSRTSRVTPHVARRDAADRRHLDADAPDLQQRSGRSELHDSRGGVHRPRGEAARAGRLRADRTAEGTGRSPRGPARHPGRRRSRPVRLPLEGQRRAGRSRPTTGSRSRASGPRSRSTATTRTSVRSRSDSASRSTARRFTSFRACTNGWISFTNTTTSYNNFALPSTSAPENLLAAFHDDLTFSRTGGTPTTTMTASGSSLSTRTSRTSARAVRIPSRSTSIPVGGSSTTTRR